MNAAKGYTPTDNPEEADLILFNTCSIREKAQEKVFSDLGRVKHLKKGRDDWRGWLRCQPGRRSHHRTRALCGRGVWPANPAPSAGHAGKTPAAKAPQVDISFPEIEKFDHLPPPRKEGSSAFVSIMEGCSKYCSYCVVPYTRGEEVSRPFDDVLTEVADLADQGVKEVTLLGQNVNGYRGKMGDTSEIADFALLLEYVAEIPGIERIRFTTSHPNEFSQRLIDVTARPASWSTTCTCPCSTALIAF